MNSTHFWAPKYTCENHPFLDIYQVNVTSYHLNVNWFYLSFHRHSTHFWTSQYAHVKLPLWKQIYTMRAHCLCLWENWSPINHLMSTDSIFLSTGIQHILSLTIYTTQVSNYPFGDKYIRSERTACVSEKIGHRSIRDFLPNLPCFFPDILSPYFSFFAAFRCIASASKTNSEDIVKRWIRVNLENFQWDWLSIFTSLPCKGFLGFVLVLPFLHPP